MKIMVQTPLKNREIQELLDGKEIGGTSFAFVEKKGIALVFEVSGTDSDSACTVAKQAIKGTDWGKILYFSVTEVSG